MAYSGWESLNTNNISLCVNMNIKMISIEHPQNNVADNYRGVNETVARKGNKQHKALTRVTREHNSFNVGNK